jgi:pheromone shutdown protein TraB
VSAVTEPRRPRGAVHLIGTAHVSARSVDEVREVIRAVKPEVVCVELCQGRFDALTSDNAFRNLDVFKVIREGKTLYLLAHLALASYQRKMGQELGVKPGAELLAAIEEAKAVGARVELIDRSIHTTLKRTWANLGLWKRSMLLASLVAGGDEEEEAEAATKGQADRRPPPRRGDEAPRRVRDAVGAVRRCPRSRPRSSTSVTSTCGRHRGRPATRASWRWSAPPTCRG